jgi:hypothetical protein
MGIALGRPLVWKVSVSTMSHCRFSIRFDRPCILRRIAWFILIEWSRYRRDNEGHVFTGGGPV